jgi:hypothetical protein
MSSDYYWDPKKDKKTHINKTPAHLLDTSPNLIAGLPPPLAADPLNKTLPGNLLDLGTWCLVDVSKSSMSECELPAPLIADKQPRVTVE